MSYYPSGGSGGRYGYGGGGGGGRGGRRGGGGGGGGGGPRIFVGNLPWDVRTSEVERLFDKFGRIVDVEIKPPPPHKRGPAFAFVEYDDPRDAQDAVDRRDGYDFDGAPIRVEFAKGAGRSRGGAAPSRAPPANLRRSDYRARVTGIPPSASWQDLKDHMRRAGEVCFAEVDGHGGGAVEFVSRDDFEYALRKLDDTEMTSRFGDRSFVRVDPDDGGRGRSPSRSRSPRGRSPSPRGRSVSRSRSPRGRRSPSPRARSASRSGSRSPPPRDRSVSRSRSPRGRRSPSPRARSASRSGSPPPRDRSASRSRSPHAPADDRSPSRSPRARSVSHSRSPARD